MRRFDHGIRKHSRVGFRQPPDPLPVSQQNLLRDPCCCRFQPSVQSRRFTPPVKEVHTYDPETPSIVSCFTELPRRMNLRLRSGLNKAANSHTVSPSLHHRLRQASSAISFWLGRAPSSPLREDAERDHDTTDRFLPSNFLTYVYSYLASLPVVAVRAFTLCA